MKKDSILNDLRPADLVLILIVLLTIVFSISYYLSSKPNSQVYIYNWLVGVCSLKNDKIIKIDSHNIVEIKKGKVRMKYADCPDKRCVKQGFTNSMPIICLPNKVIIEIRNNGEQKKLILH